MYSFEKKTIERMEKFASRLHGKYYKELQTLSASAYVTKEPVPFAKRLSGEEKKLALGDHWGDLFDCAWIHFTGQIPEGCCREELVLLLDVSGEGLCCDSTGNPVIGLTHGSVVWEYGSVRKRVVPLALLPEGDGAVDVWVDAGCNDLFGNYVESGNLKEAAIAKCYPQLRALYYDVFVLKEAFENLPEGPRRSAILKCVNDAMNVMYDYTEEEAVKARAILGKELGKQGGTPSLTVDFIGHAHIDLAWLWPVRETIRKGARTFATVDKMMDRFDDYRFGFSQPQLLEWMKKYYPSIFDAMKKRVAEGKVEVQGGMWVEADTNLTGGESLVRQILYGTRFWREEFGQEVDNVWLPDVFGYSAALPQIMAKSGMNYFMTQKLSWNEHNDFPYHTFRWKGLDGSEVLAHMLPEETYNSQASAASIRTIEQKYHEKGVCEEALALFGIGDGGGGPGTYHLEKLDRLKNFEGFSPARQRFARDFFHDIDHDREEYPCWSGELYLEKHRGTYTTQARNKKYNRLMEQALRELEYASVLGMLYAGETYPKEELDEIWKEMLLFQFHDIIPGSSIKRVYDECIPRYQAMYERVRQETERMYASVLQGTKAVNSLSFEREEYVEHEGTWYLADLPAMGCAALTQKAEAGHGLSVGADYIANEKLRVTFDEKGHICSVWDRENEREALAPEAAANILQVYDDEDGNAWDIEVFYDEKAPREFTLVSQRTALEGVDAVMYQEYVYGDSRLTQRIFLRQGRGYVEFDTHADWHERHRMLRTQFLVDVFCNEVTCDIQFGSIRRPTTKNTSWDRARFEICAHKWVDLSRDDYGVALMNDCKYGHKVFGNVLDLALLRSSDSPGKQADEGEHDFRYALYPHAGNERTARVEETALAFNHPVAVYEGKGSGRLPESFLSLDRAGVEITAVKRAEDGGAVIVRLNERDGVNTVVTLQVPDRVKGIFACNLMEEEREKLAWTGGGLALTLKPFEIVTIGLEI